MNRFTAKLEDDGRIRGGFYDRTGGVSTGLFASLNTGYGSGDALENVTENRRRVTHDLGMNALVTPHQTHSAIALKVDHAFSPEKAPKADALVTATPGLALGVLTADCAPVLFSARRQPVIGAAHAGWKGALGGILESTLACFKDYGIVAQEIYAAIGPCIGLLSYEVQEAFAAPFLAQDQTCGKFFRPAEKPGHLYFDLPGYIAQRLRNTGVQDIDMLDQDTLRQPDVFFSYRRMCLNGETAYGRQVSAIGLVY